MYLQQLSIINNTYRLTLPFFKNLLNFPGLFQGKCVLKTEGIICFNSERKLILTFMLRLALPLFF